MDDLDSIKQGLEHVGCGVRGADEYAFTEVKLDIEIVVSEGVCLLGVQKLKECCTHIALERVKAYFVNLIDYHYGVLNTELLELADKDAWLRVHIGTLATLYMDGVILATH